MKSYIYVDVLFLVNLIVNYVVLLAAGKMTNTPIQPKRIAFTSCLGALYSVSSLILPLQPLFSFPARVATGLLMVTLSYPEIRGVSFICLASSFYACSILVAGTAMALNTWGSAKLAGFSLYYTNARWWALALALAVVTASGFVWKALNLPTFRQSPFMQVEISLDGQSISVTGMVDTGNDLRDPVSGLPVIVVDWDSLKHIMPHEVSHFFLSTWDLVNTKLTESAVGKRLRLIPYTNVSGHRQILPAFKPDALYLTGKKGRFKKAAVVGVAGKPLSPQGLYQALLHPELVNAQGGVLI
ncbi:MAG: sigma-E processing peptidase SpoIIGA [Bacillota bacterium]|jgi:stage II sporulation protein GA (sporulation sigma-E factor processing peptidase)|nr:sigma-E processing peptidase SpoIIGA [Candidatus Fermentithermobacillaceae bacterium]